MCNSYIRNGDVDCDNLSQRKRYQVQFAEFATIYKVEHEPYSVHDVWWQEKELKMNRIEEKWQACNDTSMQKYLQTVAQSQNTVLARNSHELTNDEMCGLAHVLLSGNRGLEVVVKSSQRLERHFATGRTIRSIVDMHRLLREEALTTLGCNDDDVACMVRMHAVSMTHLHQVWAQTIGIADHLAVIMDPYFI